jgi:hypothetical protein
MISKKLVRRSLLLLGSLFVLFNICSCSCSCASKDEVTKVPADVMQKSDAFIKSRTGDEFFEKYITPDFHLTKHSPPNFDMVYKFSIPEKVYANGLIKFTVDSSGNVLMNRDITGIPNCFRSEDECEFKIDGKWARQIAVQHGIESGVKDWQVEFVWNPQRDRYLWHVRATYNEIQGDIGYRADGEEIFINPANGEVIAKDKWRIN